MPLDTQKFPLSRYWLSVATDIIPRVPAIFSSKHLSEARKSFLAGKNQLTAIKNWLSRAGIIELSRGKAELTDLGRLFAAENPRCDYSWTWWLLHLHLCVHDDSFPYAEFFRFFEPQARDWMTSNEVVDALHTHAVDNGQQISKASVETYYGGIDQCYRPGYPLFNLRLIERRVSRNEDGGERIRRCLGKPADIVIVYATLLFRHAFFHKQETVECRLLLEKGLARCLGLADSHLRDALTRIHQNPEFNAILQYRRQVNLDSVQFGDSGTRELRRVRKHAYSGDHVQWP